MRIQDPAQRHEPHSVRHSLQKENRSELKIFTSAASVFMHGHRTTNFPIIASLGFGKSSTTSPRDHVPKMVIPGPENGVFVDCHAKLRTGVFGTAFAEM